jgi:hypothetical protein
MAGLDPAIHVFQAASIRQRKRRLNFPATNERNDVDGRVKPGHDGSS